MATTIQIDNGGASNSAVVPSVNEMIAASVSEPERGGATTLDDLHIKIVGEQRDVGADIQITEPGKRRAPGRPRNAETPAEKTPAKRKAELVSDVARLESELAAERARHDAGSLSELSKSIELASYLLFGIVAETRGPHWAMPEAEAKQIGEAGSVAFAPYAAQMAQKLPWAVFVGVLGKAVYTRVQIDKQLVGRLGEA